MIVVLYALLAVRFFLGSPQVTVDYLAAVNARANAVPQEDQAWPIYREAWIAAGFADLDPSEGFDDNTDWHDMSPDAPQWAQAKAFLDQHAALLDALRLGGAKPGLGVAVGFDKDYSPRDRLAFHGPDAEAPTMDASPRSRAEQLAEEWLIGVLLPHLGPMRKSARLLAVDTRYAVVQGDAPRVVANLQAMLGLARQSAEPPFLINALVGISIHNLACEELQNVLAKHPDALSDTQLQQLSHRFAAFSPRAMTRIDGERMFMYDTLQRMYTDDGHGNGRVTNEGMRLMGYMGFTLGSNSPEQPWLASAVGNAAMPASLLVIASRKDMREKYDGLMSQLESDYAQPMREHPANSWEGVFENSTLRERMRYPLLYQLMPALDAIRRTVGRSEAQQEGALIALALELYRREHGGWPETLDALVPKFLPTLPVDRITGTGHCATRCATAGRWSTASAATATTTTASRRSTKKPAIAAPTTPHTGTQTSRTNPNATATGSSSRQAPKTKTHPLTTHPCGTMPPMRKPPLFLTLAALALLTSGGGCVQRMVTVTSQPNRRTGLAQRPRSRAHPGHRALHVLWHLRRPPRTRRPRTALDKPASPRPLGGRRPPIDLFAELTAAKVQLAWHFQLEKSKPTDDAAVDDLLDHAAQMRTLTETGEDPGSNPRKLPPAVTAVLRSSETNPWATDRSSLAARATPPTSAHG